MEVQAETIQEQIQEFQIGGGGGGNDFVRTAHVMSAKSLLRPGSTGRWKL